MSKIHTNLAAFDEAIEFEAGDVGDPIRSERLSVVSLHERGNHIYHVTGLDKGASGSVQIECELKRR